MSSHRVVPVTVGQRVGGLPSLRKYLEDPWFVLLYCLVFTLGAMCMTKVFILIFERDQIRPRLPLWKVLWAIQNASCLWSVVNQARRGPEVVL